MYQRLSNQGWNAVPNITLNSAASAKLLFVDCFLAVNCTVCRAAGHVSLYDTHMVYVLSSSVHTVVWRIDQQFAIKFSVAQYLGCHWVSSCCAAHPLLPHKLWICLNKVGFWCILGQFTVTDECCELPWPAQAHRPNVMNSFAETVVDRILRSTASSACSRNISRVSSWRALFTVGVYWVAIPASYVRLKYSKHIPSF